MSDDTEPETTPMLKARTPFEAQVWAAEFAIALRQTENPKRACGEANEKLVELRKRTTRYERM